MADVLVADDDPVVRHILGSILKMFGHTFVAVESGQACLDELKSRREACTLPQVLFLDMFFPDMLGADMLKELRKVHSKSELPVVMLSANSQQEALALAPNIEGEEYLSKPFAPNIVQEVLERLLKA